MSVSRVITVHIPKLYADKYVDVGFFFSLPLSSRRCDKISTGRISILGV